MKVLITMLLCSMAATVGHAQSLNCSKFKNGKFKISYDGKTDTVIRAGNLQTEIFNATTKATFTVKWVGDCSYTLTPTAETIKAQPNMPTGAVTVTITKTDGRSCSQTITSNFSQEVIKVRVEKLD